MALWDQVFRLIASSVSVRILVAKRHDSRDAKRKRDKHNRSFHFEILVTKI